ncbi:hypothetical protein VTK73DRAFT_9444 [Phialemonium thermophilum]|uniref:Transmembrane protein n=1 Tax=Phialemonium thermophilum TaxID=223376 RepID=A0ABR3XKX0_9PEZI
MARHRDQAEFEWVGWRLKLLIPLWTAQVAMLLGLMGIFSYRLAETVQRWEEKDKKGKLPMVELVWECTNVGFSVLSLLLSIVEIVKTSSETLTPFVMLATNAVKMACSSAILGLDIVVYLRRSDEHYSIVGLAIDCGLLAATLIAFIYAIVTFRKLRKYDSYHPTNVKHFGYRDDDMEMGNNVRVSATKPRSVSSVTMTSITSYPSQTAAGTGASTGSTGPTPSSQPSEGGARRYSHQRDTLYEEYLGHRASVTLKHQIDRTVGAEFGWGAERPSSGEPTVVLPRTDSFVTSGVVPSAAVAGREVVRRESEYSLMAVPEDAGGVDEGWDLGQRGNVVEEDSQALLGEHNGDEELGGRSIPKYRDDSASKSGPDT